MPVNLGAPVARNWLRAQPEVAAADWVAYLDDDALVPPDWLERFGQAVALDPDASAWGCRVVDAAPPPRVQSADLHVCLRPGAGEGVFDLPLGLLDVCSQDLDFGQLDYSRPCVSVTGCCHLFRTEALLAGPEFDVRFSPTQYDDLDRDLQIVLAGGRAFYHGALRVEHLRSSGARIKQSREARGASYGNLVKVNHKYALRQIQAIEQADLGLMEQDIERKLWELDHLFTGDDA